MWSSEFVPGARYGKKKDVYILTSKHTFSAAEDFSYALKNLKRATVVGETTGGGAHPGDMVRLNAHFAMFVPNGRSISTVTNIDWEGVGVTPELSVRAEDALKVAQVAALKKIATGEKNQAKVARINARIAAVESENTDGTMAR
jgi:C-terminal processing protease CtpA/Prc